MSAGKLSDHAAGSDVFDREVNQGADFAEMARMHSESGSRDAGGDLGFFEQGELMEALAGPAFELSPGEVSGVIKLTSAFYIIRVEEKDEAATQVLDEVRNEVAGKRAPGGHGSWNERWLRRTANC